MKDHDLRDMCRVDLEDEVMLLRAQVKVLQNAVAYADEFIRAERFDTDNEIYTLREQSLALRGIRVIKEFDSPGAMDKKFGPDN